MDSEDVLKEDIALLKKQITTLYDIIHHNTETIASINTDMKNIDDLSSGMQEIIHLLFEKNIMSQDDVDLVLTRMKL